MIKDVIIHEIGLRKEERTEMPALLVLSHKGG
jgi:hypothetical protein